MRTQRKKSFLTILSIAFISFGLQCAHATVITPIAGLKRIVGISDDGNILAGYGMASPVSIVLNRSNNDYQTMPDFFGFARRSAVSKDGSTVGLFRYGSENFSLGYWSPSTRSAETFDLSNSGITFFAWDSSFSGDGRSFTGQISFGEQPSAFKQSKETGLVLPTLSGGLYSTEGVNISHDGSIVSGESHSKIAQAPFIWREGTPAKQVLVDGVTSIRFDRASGDGKIFAGYATGGVNTPPNAGSLELGLTEWGDNGLVAFKYTESDGVEFIPGMTQVTAMNETGSVIGGRIMSGQTRYPDTAVIWTESKGTQRIDDFLKDRGANLSYWSSLDQISEITPNGRWIAGTGTNFFGEKQAYVIDTLNTPPVSVPEPSTFILMAVGLLGFLRKAGSFNIS